MGGPTGGRGAFQGVGGPGGVYFTTALAAVVTPVVSLRAAHPADAPVEVVGQGVDQPAAATGDTAGDGGPIMLLVPQVPAPLTAATDPMMVD